MHKAIGRVLAGLGAVAITGAAAAASQDRHTMNVPLPDGSSVRVDYVGDVAPKVTVTPGPLAAGFPAFGMFDRSMFDMQRQIDAMMREIDRTAKVSVTGAPGLNVAAYGNAPVGSSSVTVVSTSDGNKTCTRTTEVISEGAGKPAKVVSKVNGDCGAADAPGKPVT